MPSPSPFHGDLARSRGIYLQVTQLQSLGKNADELFFIID
jgi:hypothetical protein